MHLRSGPVYTSMHIHVCACTHTHIQWDFLPPQLFTQRTNKILPATIKFTFYNGRDHKGTTMGPDFWIQCRENCLPNTTTASYLKEKEQYGSANTLPSWGIFLSHYLFWKKDTLISNGHAIKTTMNNLALWNSCFYLLWNSLCFYLLWHVPVLVWDGLLGTSGCPGGSKISALREPKFYSRTTIIS